MEIPMQYVGSGLPYRGLAVNTVGGFSWGGLWDSIGKPLLGAGLAIGTGWAVGQLTGSSNQTTVQNTQNPQNPNNSPSLPGYNPALPTVGIPQTADSGQWISGVSNTVVMAGGAALLGLAVILAAKRK